MARFVSLRIILTTHGAYFHFPSASLEQGRSLGNSCPYVLLQSERPAAVVRETRVRAAKPQRNKEAWKYLDGLPDDVQSDISTVLLLTPDEKQTSFANFEIDDPVPSRL